MLHSVSKDERSVSSVHQSLLVCCHYQHSNIIHKNQSMMLYWTVSCQQLPFHKVGPRGHRCGTSPLIITFAGCFRRLQWGLPIKQIKRYNTHQLLRYTIKTIFSIQLDHTSQPSIRVWEDYCTFNCFISSRLTSVISLYSSSIHASSSLILPSISCSYSLL